MILSDRALTILGLTNQGSRPGGAGDAIEHTLYDTVKFATGWNQLVEFFSVPQGAAQLGVTKSFGHTNMVEARKLAAGNRFVIEAIAISFVQSSGAAANANQTPDTVADAIKKIHAFYHLLNYSVLRVKMSTLEFEFETPMSAWLPTLPVVGTDIASPNTAVARVGDYLAQKVLKLGQQIVIANTDGSPSQFSVQILPDQNIASVTDALTVLATDGDALRVSLIGGMVRSK